MNTRSLQLDHTIVSNLFFGDCDTEKYSDINDKSKEFSLGYCIRYSGDKDAKSFYIDFDFSTVTEESKSLDIKFSACFTTNWDIDEEFQKSNFPKVNAPAIAYPFLRAFISTFLVNAGYKPAILPSINFVEVSKQGVEIAKKPPNDPKKRIAKKKA